MKIRLSKQFRKDILKLNKKQINQYKEKLTIFISKPNHPILNNHKLKGDMKDYCSFNISGDIRVQYYFYEDTIRFVRIGSHSELY